MENYLDQIWWLDIYTRLFIAFNQSQSDSRPEQHSATYLPLQLYLTKGGVSCILQGKDIKYAYITKPRVKRTF